MEKYSTNSQKYSISHQWLAQGEEKTLIITNEYHESTSVNQIASLALELTRHDYKPPFNVKLRYKRAHLETSPLGKKLISCIKLDHKYIHKTFTGHKFSPMIQIILEAIRETEESYLKNYQRSFIEETYDIKFATEYEYKRIAEDYNSFAMKLRQDLLDEGMKEHVRSFTRNAKERYKKFLLGCSAALERHSRCLGIRLDTASRRKAIPYREFSETTTEMFNEECSEIDKHRDNFVKHLNRTFGKDLAFYAWKIEYGVSRGFHIHWFLLLNGNKYQDRINIPMRLGEHWKDTITNGNGTYRNVNFDHSEQSSGLGVKHHSDASLWSHLEGIASYLTKVDYHIKIALPGNMRSFGCSKLKKQIGCKPGPKRKSMLSATPSQ